MIGPIGGSDVFRDQTTVRGVEEGGGKLAELHGWRDLVVVGDVERQVEMIAAGVGADCSRFVHSGDYQESNLWIVSVVVVEFLDGGHLGDALDAPCSPEVEEDDLTFAGGEGLWCAVQGAVGQFAGRFGLETKVRRLHAGGDPVLD